VTFDTFGFVLTFCVVCFLWFQTWGITDWKAVQPKGVRPPAMLVTMHQRDLILSGLAAWDETTGKIGDSLHLDQASLAAAATAYLIRDYQNHTVGLSPAALQTMQDEHIFHLRPYGPALKDEPEDEEEDEE